MQVYRVDFLLHRTAGAYRAAYRRSVQARRGAGAFHPGRHVEAAVQRKFAVALDGRALDFTVQIAVAVTQRFGNAQFYGNRHLSAGLARERILRDHQVQVFLGNFAQFQRDAPFVRSTQVGRHIRAVPEVLRHVQFQHGDFRLGRPAGQRE